MKLKANKATSIQPGQRLKRGDISNATGWAPESIRGSSGVVVKQFGNRTVISNRPKPTAAVGSGGSGTKFLGYFDYFPPIPTGTGSYEFFYTTESNGYRAYGGQTAWTALQKLTTSTGIPT